MAPVLSLLTFGLLSVQAAWAHPGHDVAEEAAERAAFYEKRSPKSVRSCAAQLESRGLTAAALARRGELAHKVRAKRGITSPLGRRDLWSNYNFTHEASGHSFGEDELNLFSDNSTCILQPEATQGPYYIDGELIRQNVVEDQAGVPLYLDVQVIDTSDCTPAPAVYMDFWQCNATGVYSGVVHKANGNTDDLANINTTFLRGIVETDINGVAQIETIFPGHYTGRATHIHILAHNANETTFRANNTLLGSNGTASASHVGQLFFDTDLIAQVEATEPYNQNTQELLSNAQDSILETEAGNADPFVQWVMIGDDITDGIMAWISIGIDSTAADDVAAASTMYASGGVANDFHYSGPSGVKGQDGGKPPQAGSA